MLLNSNVRFRIASINNVSDVMTNATWVQYLQEMSVVRRRADFAEVVKICEAEYNQSRNSELCGNKMKNRSKVSIGICQSNEISADNIGIVNILGEVESVKCVTQ